jgi:prepilin-type N-terminal cleavage/methylation domain-containing protein
MKTSANRRSKNGFTLVEMLFAIALLLIGVLALASIFGTAAQSAHSQGDLGEDVAVCESKMESLRTLNFTDNSTDTTQLNAQGQFPSTGGTGLSPGGSTTIPITGYVDYLDRSGAYTAAGGAIYARMWQITDLATAPADSKKILVRCVDQTLKTEFGANRPDLTLVTVISQ